MKNRIDWSAVIAVALFALIALTSCESRSGRELTEEQKWELFRECSRDEGDLGCEICYQKIFGKPSEGYYFSGF